MPANVDAAHDGWELWEAVMHTADQDALATIHGAMRDLAARDFLFEVPDWWCLELAPPPGEPIERPGLYLDDLYREIERDFRQRLAAGELTCTARSQSLERVDLPADIWADIVIDWAGECLHVGMASFHAVRIQRPPSVAQARPVRRDRLRDWVADHIDKGEREGLALAERELGGDVPRGLYRAVRQELARERGKDLRPGKRRQV